MSRMVPSRKQHVRERTVAATYARRNLGELLNRVHYGRERILITMRDEVIAVLESPEQDATEDEHPAASTAVA